jgi:hypothetical protein
MLPKSKPVKASWRALLETKAGVLAGAKAAADDARARNVRAEVEICIVFVILRVRGVDKLWL